MSIQNFLSNFSNFSNFPVRPNQNRQTTLPFIFQRPGQGNNTTQMYYQPVNIYQNNSQQYMFSLMSSMMQMMTGLFSRGYFPPTNNYPPSNPSYPTLPVEPPVLPPTVCPPPPTTGSDQVLGSAGLFGDPKFGVFTPGLGTIPSALNSFESGIKAGQTVTLLQDSDLGGLSVTGTGVQVDPNNANSTGIGQATFTSGTDTVTIKGSGELLVNGALRGNINDAGSIAPIQLANGLTVSTGTEIDGPNGETAERFVISNGEYKMTAAARKPHPDSNGYLDMNFAELTATAANNANGYQTSVPGLTNQFGIPGLLRLNPNNVGMIA